jgi:peptidoglycan/xylan/chitin deacetylase (PgdA/CDA1 family)
MGGYLSILMYHQVGDFPPMRAHRANYCHYRRFAAQMGFLKRFGYRVLRMEEALGCLGGQRPWPGRAVVLTFDDGYEGFFRYALPELQRHGFPAMVYLISGYLGRAAEWFAKDPGRPVPRLMGPAEARRLRDEGMEVGSHTVTHPKLAEVDPARQHRELADSKAALEDLLGVEVAHLCYPFGSFNRSTVESAADAGYRSAVTCLRGSAEPQDHPLVLPRKAISFGDNLLGFGWKLGMKNRPIPALRAWRERRAELIG